MTRSNRRSVPDPPPQRDGDDESRTARRNQVITQALLVGLIVIFSSASLFWMLSDITGEYMSTDNRAGVIRLSLVRRATNLQGELTYGRGAVLEMKVPSGAAEKEVNWTFKTPQDQVFAGQRSRTIQFTGTIENGVIKGQLTDGPNIVPIKLQRSGFVSLYRQIQSHLPFSG